MEHYTTITLEVSISEYDLRWLTDHTVEQINYGIMALEYDLKRVAQEHLDKIFDTARVTIQ